MSLRLILKRVIVVLSIFLFVEVGFFIYQLTSATAGFARNLDLGNKYLLSEDYDGAIEAFSKAIEIDGMNADAYIGRGDAYKAKGDYANAWSDYEKAQTLSGDTDLLRKKIGTTEMSIVTENGDGVDGATVRFNGTGHSYEFKTDNDGHVSAVVFPETYKVEISKENYESANLELSAENGGVEAKKIQLKEDASLNPEPTVAAENIFTGVVTLNEAETADVKTTSNGGTYQIRYDTSESSDYVSLDLRVNGMAESYRLGDVMEPIYESVYVADIDPTDSYSNIIVVVYAIDEVTMTYLFAFNENEIQMVSDFWGHLVPESITGDGKMFIEFWVSIGMQDYGNFTVRAENAVHDLAVQEVKLHSGRTQYSGGTGHYQEGFEVTLSSDMTVYQDASCTAAVGTIPAGTRVTCEYAATIDHRERIFIKGGANEGYVTTNMLKEACNNIYYGA